MTCEALPAAASLLVLNGDQFNGSCGFRRLNMLREFGAGQVASNQLGKS